jgi:hypothetical protein
VAVGGETNAGWLVTRNGSSWTARKAPLPAGAATGAAANTYLSSVACPSSTSCVAVGGYTDAAQHQQGLLLTRSGTSWTAVRAPRPAGAETVGVESVACPAVSSCVAAGGYLDSSSHSFGLLFYGHGSSWKALKVPLPANALPDQAFNGTQLISVACGSASSCTAVGYYAGPEGAQLGLILSGHGSTWKAVEAPPAAKGDYGILTAVTCPTAATCVAAGAAQDKPLFETGHGTSWVPGTAKMPAGADSLPLPELNSIACSSAKACTAVGEYLNPQNNSIGLLVSGYGSAWASAKMPLPAGARTTPGPQLNSVACRKVCVAAGYYTDSSGNGQVALVTRHGASWVAARAPLPANALAVRAGQQGSYGPPNVFDITCVSATVCAAAGYYPVKPGKMEGLLLAGPA